jgi:hypothetical protein
VEATYMIDSSKLANKDFSQRNGNKIKNNANLVNPRKKSFLQLVSIAT